MQILISQILNAHIKAFKHWGSSSSSSSLPLEQSIKMFVPN